MRTPKYGDKCEHAQYDQKLGKNIRTCPVLHMTGKPPGQLVARVQDQWTILVCTAHAGHLEAPNVRKQRKPKVVAEQIDLVTEAMKRAAFNDQVCYSVRIPMPEGE